MRSERFTLTGGFLLESAHNDLDGNGVVDLFDYELFDSCFTGPEFPIADPQCVSSDFNGDGRVDMIDWRAFQINYIGFDTQ